MDYIKEIINILENNAIRTIPSNEVLALHPDIALAAWKNFVVNGDYYGNYDFQEWYSEANWADKLLPYKDDVEFWMKAIDLLNSNDNFNKNVILNESFQKDFPVIKEKILSNNDFVISLYKSTSDTSFLNVLNLPQEEKNIIEKNHILTYTKYASTDSLKFQNDTIFTKELLQKWPNLYTGLNDKNKLNDNYIELALKDSRISIKDLPKEKQNQYFTVWLDANKDSIKLSSLQELNQFQKIEVLKVKPEFIGQVFDSNPIAYKEVAVSTIEKDIYAVRHLNSQQLNKIFSEKENFDRIKPVLESYAKSYHNTKEISKMENKIFSLIDLDRELKKLLKNNIFYQLNTMPKEQKITPNQFNKFFEAIKEKVENEGLSENQADAFLVRMKNKLDPEELKLNKFPSVSLYQHLNIEAPKKLKM